MNSSIHARILSLLLILVCAALLIPQASIAQQQPTRIFLPVVLNPNLIPNPFGFDMRVWYDDKILTFATEANPKWIRAGDIFWSDVEPTPGVYNWNALAGVENNIKRIRLMGFEPVVIVQRTPAWAQSVPGRLCSPPRPEQYGAFARFVGTLSARYASGPLTVRYWELWNEPDYSAEMVADNQGIGCLLRGDLPNQGGNAYGEMVKLATSAIKANNPGAYVMAGSIANEFQTDTRSVTFLRGMLSTGAGASIDALSFHSYGELDAGDLLVNKTLLYRRILAEFRLADKPLFVTETGATCFSLRDSKPGTCSPDFLRAQANYASRIYPQALALRLSGALWFSLIGTGPTFMANAQLVDENNGVLTPRPAFYAFRNSAKLLQGTAYIGPPLREPTPDQRTKVQVLTFRRGSNTLYVLWVPETQPGFPVYYELTVPPRATIICTDQLNLDQPAVYLCPDQNPDDTILPRAINELPQYIEVIGQ